MHPKLELIRPVLPKPNQKLFYFCETFMLVGLFLPRYLNQFLVCIKKNLFLYLAKVIQFRGVWLCYTSSLLLSLQRSYFLRLITARLWQRRMWNGVGGQTAAGLLFFGDAATTKPSIWYSRYGHCMTSRTRGASRALAISASRSTTAGVCLFRMMAFVLNALRVSVGLAIV